MAQPDVRKAVVPRWFAVLMLAAHVGWRSVAPELQARLGHLDEAAWLGLFLTPTTLIGSALGVGLIVRRTWPWVLSFLVVFALHIAVGFGAHPT